MDELEMVMADRSLRDVEWGIIVHRALAGVALVLEQLGQLGSVVQECVFLRLLDSAAVLEDRAPSPGRSHLLLDQLQAMIVEPVAAILEVRMAAGIVVLGTDHGN